METTFVEKVWRLTKKIPKGRVLTYKALAKKLSCKAYRAVGNALNKNKSKKVPCHRVVKSSGEVGGFAKGKKKKIAMLKKEGIKISKNKIVEFKKVLFKF